MMKRHLSENEYAAYSGYQFTGKDPWEGKLPVTIRDITDGKMEWTFTDSFDDHTLYLVQKETVLQNAVDEFRQMLYNNFVFRAGCDSPPAVRVRER